MKHIDNTVGSGVHVNLKCILALAAVFAACIIAFTAMSDDSSATVQDGGWYTFDDATGVMTVTGPETDYVDWNMRSAIKEIVITNTVTSVEEDSFNGCNNVTSLTFEEGSTLEYIGGYSFCGIKVISVVIPKSVTTIDYGAFCDCPNLRSVQFETGTELEYIGDDAFYYCQNLESLDTIPATVTYIGYEFIGSTKIKTVEFAPGFAITSFDGLFRQASGLKSVTIPDSVTSARSAFENCSSLTSVTFGSGLTEIADWMFRGCTSLRSISIPATVTAIKNNAFENSGIENITLKTANLGTYVFSNSKNLRSVTFDVAIDALPQGMFSGCESLTTINGIAGVTSFGDCCFQNCKSLKTFTVPDGVTQLPNSCFYGAGLTSIDLNNVTWVGDSALGGTQLTSVDLARVTYLGSGSLSGTRMTYVNLTGITDLGAVFQNSGDTLKKVVLDDGLTTIPSYMFSGCTGLTSVEYGDEIISFGARAFYNCKSLAEIKVPSKLQVIGQDCFYHCDKMETFVANPELNTLYTEAFYYCESLISVDLSASAIKTLDRYTFYYCNALTEVIFPNGLETMRERVFYECPSLEYLHIPSSVTTIYPSYYSSWNTYPLTYGCHFKEISGGEGLVKIVDSAFSGMQADKISLNFASTSEYAVVEGVLCKPVEGGYHALMFPAITGDYVFPDEIISMDGRSVSICTATSLTFSPNMKEIRIDIASESKPNDTLVKVVIPEGVQKLLGSNTTSFSSWTGGAFDWCVALKEVSLPSTLTEIGGITFRDCYSLESITLPENLKLLGADQYRGYVFTNCTALKSVNLPYNVSVIEQNCFQGCTALESIDLSYVETVDQGAFTGCTALKEIKFGQYMNKIYNTFHNLDSLETVTLDGVDLQVQNCFQDCPALKKLVISADVKSITGSFRKCDALSEIEVAPENPYLYASGGILYTADLKTLVLIAAGIENVDIPDSVTGGTLSSVPNGIKSVTFGMGLTNFEGSCRWFSGCKTLETVTIKNASARVVYCFDNCTALRELNVNEGCTGFMMGGCTALKRLVVPSTATQFSFENMDVPELIIADGNETLAMEGNVLYNKNTNQLLLVLNKSSVTIPSGVTWNYQITADNVTMGDGVPSISGVYVRQAKTVTLDADLEHIGDYVFYQCPGMTDLYILGDSITFGDYAFGDGECTQEIRVHSNIPGEFLSNVVGPTFVYLSGLGVDVVMNTGDHVSVEDYPAPKADEGGSISFTAHAEKGYVLKVTATGGTVASDNGVYTISAIPAAGTTVSLSADYVGIISEKVELERRHLTVMVGDAIAIGFAVTPFDSTEAVVWTSSDPSVVKVGDDGIKAVAGGKATLTATSGSQTATCEVTVNAPNVGPSDDTKSDSGSDNTLVISLGGCIAVLAIVGIACVLIRRRA